jgi:hypothetical protein
MDTKLALNCGKDKNEIDELLKQAPLLPILYDDQIKLKNEEI